jgi:hypothetical protein
MLTTLFRPTFVQNVDNVFFNVFVFNIFVDAQEEQHFLASGGEVVGNGARQPRAVAQEAH